MSTNASQASRVRRLTINLSDEVYRELERLAKSRRSSMTEIVRLGLGLARIAAIEAKSGNKLIVTTGDGQPIKELVIT